MLPPSGVETPVLLPSDDDVKRASTENSRSQATHPPPTFAPTPVATTSTPGSFLAPSPAPSSKESLGKERTIVPAPPGGGLSNTERTSNRQSTTNCLGAIGIAAQHPPAGPQACRFYLLDGSPVDSALSGQLGRLKDVLPHPVTNVTVKLGTTFGGLAEEMKCRQESTSDDQSAHLYHHLRRPAVPRPAKSDDDFGDSRYDEDKPAPPSKIFGDVLRDGPPVGIHTLIWCDSVNNMNRTLDRQGMKEFENRILFQMSANDSSTLIDTPAASKLGENRRRIQRGREPDREVPAVRITRSGVAREREAEVRRDGRSPRCMFRPV